MFVTFEGIEGAGKGLLISKVSQWLEKKQCSFVLTREPGGSELGVVIRSLLLDIRQDVVPEAELFMYLADRAQHVRKVIKPALTSGKIVLSDRYADSTIVYQGYGRGLPLQTLLALNEVAVGGLWPDITLLLDLPPEMGLARARSRNKEEGLEVTEGKFEAEKLDFHHRIRNGYLTFAKEHQNRFVVLDATKSPDEVFSAAKSVLKQKIGVL